MLKNYLKIFFFFLIFFNIFLFSNAVLAVEIPFNPQVTIDSTFRHNQEKVISGSSIGEYLRSIYNYALATVGILATVVMMWGGLLWISSAGNAERVGEAKAWIGSALSGLALALCSYTILYIVNPELVSFRELDIKNPNSTIVSSEKKTESVNLWKTGCCKIKSGQKETCESLTAEKCSEHPTYISFEEGICSSGGMGLYACSKDDDTTDTDDGEDTCDTYGTDDVIVFNPSNSIALNNNCDAYDADFQEAASQSGINKKLLKAIAMAESACDPEAVSPKGACGIMQMMPGTSGMTCEEAKADPGELIKKAAEYLSSNSSGLSQNDLIAGYNTGYGPTSVSGEKAALAESEDCPGEYAYECCMDPGGLSTTQDYVWKINQYINAQ